jgi:hypothetical protein
MFFQMVSWLPLDTAAKSLLDVCQSPATEFPSVVHVVHPRPVQWSSIMAAFAQVVKARTGEDLSLLPFGEWNQMVVQAASSSSSCSGHQHFPSTKIQTTFDGISQGDSLARSLYGSFVEGVESLGSPCLQTSVCESLSPTLRSIPALCRDDVTRWMDYWEGVGLFKIN